MSKIDNLTKRLVILRLNSGKSLFLDPGKTSKEIPEAELEHNAMVKKLRERGVIAVPPKRSVRKQQPIKRPKKEGPVLSTPKSGTGLGKTNQENKDKQKKPKSKGGK